VIASSFADIFFNNCFKNGVLPVILKEEEMDVLFSECEANEGYQITVDLAQKKVIRPNGEFYTFEVDDFRRHCLLNGLDDIGLTLQVADDIKTFEEKAKVARPWVFQALR
jgi:3-isopropylmalate/(R)-2-methylmalate dehydratase small subunit